MFANDTTENNAIILELMDKQKKQSGAHIDPQYSYDHYKNIIEMRKECEKITCAPYPKDPSQPMNIQELVLKQQFFFVSATLSDILRRFLKKNQSWEKLPDKV